MLATQAASLRRRLQAIRLSLARAAGVQKTDPEEQASEGEVKQELRRRVAVALHGLGVLPGDVRVLAFLGRVARVSISRPTWTSVTLKELHTELRRELKLPSSAFRAAGAVEVAVRPGAIEAWIDVQPGRVSPQIDPLRLPGGPRRTLQGQERTDSVFTAGAAPVTAWHRLNNGTAFARDFGATEPENNSTPTTPANVQGIAENSAEDLRAFRTNIILQVSIITVCFLIAGLGMVCLPLVFKGEAKEGEVSNGFFGWVAASFRVGVEEVIVEAGLDRGMFIQFLNFAMRTLAAVGVPLILILCPLHYYYGGHAAGQDKLSMFDMANVSKGSWLCWVHAATVWYVVLTVQWCVFSQRRPFVENRVKWLIEMPAPRSTTVLVEDVPEDKNTGEELKRYFDEEVFGKAVVKCAYVVKDTTELQKAIQKLRNTDEMLAVAQSGKRDVVLKAMGGSESTLLASQINAQQHLEALRREVDRSSDLNLDSAFVTFLTRRDAAIVMRLFLAHDEEISVSLPPAPSDIIWEDLIPKGSPQVQAARESLGYVLGALLFVVFVPIVLWISAIARWESLHATFGNIGFSQDPFAYAQEHYPEKVALWNGLVGTLVLTGLMGIVPTFLMWIFQAFFLLKSRSRQQLKLQVWYFYFLVVFVLLVTAIGSSDFGLLQTVTFLIRNPLEIFPRLAEKMPSSTHFYLEYLLVQWGTQALNITRYLNVLKYLALRNLYDPDTAKKMSEPEDQDFYGIGSLSARATLYLTISLVFCTLSPLITIIGILNFALARLIHGYLCVYAETRKPDIGGDFFFYQLVHTQQGLFLYIILMTGVLMEMSDSWVPGAISASSFGYLYNTYLRFQREFQPREIGLHEMQDEDADAPLRIYAEDPRRASQEAPEEREHYKQPELPPPIQAAGGNAGSVWSAWLGFGPFAASAVPRPPRRSTTSPPLARHSHARRATSQGGASEALC